MIFVNGMKIGVQSQLFTILHSGWALLLLLRGSSLDDKGQEVNFSGRFRQTSVITCIVMAPVVRGSYTYMQVLVGCVMGRWSLGSKLLFSYHFYLHPIVPLLSTGTQDFLSNLTPLVHVVHPRQYSTFLISCAASCITWGSVVSHVSWN